jgi:hypothetical protein
MRAFILLLALTALLASAGPKGKAAKPPPAAPLTAPTAATLEALGDRTLSMVASGAVVATDVKAMTGVRPEPAKAIGSEFERVLPPATLTEPQAQTLRAILYDDRSYRLGADVSRCAFSPHASFGFQNGLETLELVVSFSCNQLLVMAGKPGGRWLSGGTFDVKPSRAALLKLLRAVLPANSAVQGLK